MIVHTGVTILPELELLATCNCEGVECEGGGGDSDVGGGDSEEREEAGSGDTSEAGCTWDISVGWVGEGRWRGGMINMYHMHTHTCTCTYTLCMMKKA